MLLLLFISLRLSADPVFDHVLSHSEVLLTLGFRLEFGASLFQRLLPLYFRGEVVEAVYELVKEGLDFHYLFFIESRVQGRNTVWGTIPIDGFESLLLLREDGVVLRNLGVQLSQVRSLLLIILADHCQRSGRRTLLGLACLNTFLFLCACFPLFPILLVLGSFELGVIAMYLPVFLAFLRSI